MSEDKELFTRKMRVAIFLQRCLFIFFPQALAGKSSKCPKSGLKLRVHLIDKHEACKGILRKLVTNRFSKRLEFLFQALLASPLFRHKPLLATSLRIGEQGVFRVGYESSSRNLLELCPNASHTQFQPLAAGSIQFQWLKSIHNNKIFPGLLYLDSAVSYNRLKPQASSNLDPLQRSLRCGVIANAVPPCRGSKTPFITRVALYGLTQFSAAQRMHDSPTINAQCGTQCASAYGLLEASLSIPLEAQIRNHRYQADPWSQLSFCSKKIKLMQVAKAHLRTGLLFTGGHCASGLKYTPGSLQLQPALPKLSFAALEVGGCLQLGKHIEIYIGSSHKKSFHLKIDAWVTQEKRSKLAPIFSTGSAHKLPTLLLPDFSWPNVFNKSVLPCNCFSQADLPPIKTELDAALCAQSSAKQIEHLLQKGLQVSNEYWSSAHAKARRNTYDKPLLTWIDISQSSALSTLWQSSGRKGPTAAQQRECLLKNGDDQDLWIWLSSGASTLDAQKELLDLWPRPALQVLLHSKVQRDLDVTMHAQKAALLLLLERVAPDELNSAQEYLDGYSFVGYQLSRSYLSNGQKKRLIDALNQSHRLGDARGSFLTHALSGGVDEDQLLYRLLPRSGIFEKHGSKTPIWDAYIAHLKRMDRLNRLNEKMLASLSVWKRLLASEEKDQLGRNVLMRLVQDKIPAKWWAQELPIASDLPLSEDAQNHSVWNYLFSCINRDMESEYSALLLRLLEAASNTPGFKRRIPWSELYRLEASAHYYRETELQCKVSYPAVREFIAAQVKRCEGELAYKACLAYCAYLNGRRKLDENERLRNEAYRRRYGYEREGASNRSSKPHSSPEGKKYLHHWANFEGLISHRPCKVNCENQTQGFCSVPYSSDQLQHKPRASLAAFACYVDRLLLECREVFQEAGMTHPMLEKTLGQLVEVSQKLVAQDSNVSEAEFRKLEKTMRIAMHSDRIGPDVARLMQETSFLEFAKAVNVLLCGNQPPAPILTSKIDESFKACDNYRERLKRAAAAAASNWKF